MWKPLIWVGALMTGCVLATPSMAASSDIRSCLNAASAAHRLPPVVLVVLLNVEGGRLGKVSQNSNGTVDIGPMQINTIWVGKLARRWGASQQDTYLALRDSFCANVEAGAWILRSAIDEAEGDFWEGVALYHSHTDKYKQRYLGKVLEQTLRLRRKNDVELAPVAMERADATP